MFSFNPKEKRNYVPFSMSLLFVCGSFASGDWGGDVFFLGGNFIGIGILYFIMSAISNLIAIPLEKIKGRDNIRAQDQRV